MGCSSCGKSVSIKKVSTSTTGKKVIVVKTNNEVATTPSGQSPASVYYRKKR